MNVQLRCRGGWWYAHIRQTDGARVRKALGTQSEAEARELVKLGKLEQIATADRADAITRDFWTRILAGRDVSGGEAMEAYGLYRDTIGHATSTMERDAYTLDHFFRFNGLASKTVSAITTAHVSDYVNEEADLSMRRREIRLSTLNTFLEWCVSKHWLVVNPALEVRVRIDRMTQEQLMPKPFLPFSDDEVKLLLSNIPRAKFWHGAVMIGNTYGLRLGAVVTLEWGNVVANQLRVYTRKGRRIVHERLTDELIEWLEFWKGIREPSDLPYIFPAQAARGGSRCANEFSDLVKRCGITGDKTFSGFRKSATARVWNAALDELGDKQARLLAQMVAKNGYRKIQELLGHSPGSDVTDRHYLAPNQNA